MNGSMQCLVSHRWSSVARAWLLSLSLVAGVMCVPVRWLTCSILKVRMAVMSTRLPRWLSVEIKCAHAHHLLSVATRRVSVKEHGDYSNLGSEGGDDGNNIK